MVILYTLVDIIFG